MIISISKRQIQKSFEKTKYRFTEIPKHTFQGNYGIYVHVPFCYTKCSFCPFYKEIYTEELKEKYMERIQQEIDDTNLEGKVKWIYFGGGTPNTLSVEELSLIMRRFKSKVKFDSVGIELLPSILTKEYLEGLKEIGFTKISVGIESFSDKVLRKTGRKVGQNTNLEGLINYAKEILNLWVNTDMMVGLPNQDNKTFKEDIKLAGVIKPDQITIYPYMILRGQARVQYLNPKEQFILIEEAAGILEKLGYERKSVWTLALGDNLYDTSRDELIEDYIGFGPAGFSTYSNWKVVNPEVSAYIKNRKNRRKKGFVAQKSKASDEWRKFARMLYDLKCNNSKDFPRYINAYIRLLKLTGYSKKGVLTDKGRILANEITKTVVESLPFPIQNPNCIENYEEYVTFLNS